MTSVHDQMRPASSSARSVGAISARFDLVAPDSSAQVSVTGLTSSSGDVVPGDLFVATQGFTSHGARYAADAVRRGAVAILTDAHGRKLVAESVRSLSATSATSATSSASGATGAVPVLLVPDGADVRALLSGLAAWFYGDPADSLLTFGVTGTNGKTTTTYLLDQLSRAQGRTVGLIGTVETRSGDRVLPSRLTTPDAATLQAVLATMREDGVQTLAMEVSSHALALNRVDGIVFDMVGFTNLSQDHLDFHETLDEYFAAKVTLFTPERARRGVVVVDGRWGRRFAEAARIPVATLSVESAGATDWWVTDVVPESDGSAFTLRHRDGRSIRTRTALPGAFNVANAALALTMVVEAGADTEALSAALDLSGGLDAAVPGRMELVGASPRVVVDFAHNADALELAISALRPTTRGRLTVVFGATGDRDKGKRPTMGAVAARAADVVVITDDDPHGEPAEGIRADVLVGAREVAAGAPGETRAHVVEVLEIAPRARAIREVVLAAQEDDTVLVAGRGHEVWQEIDGVNHPLDDRVEVRAALAARVNNTKEHDE
ncbi:UDP-N-acetylmuramoyl-L-alanyl-D-glutamate--2,6-diaminopimelate ligase [Sanguibacter sp. 25GB23B1]|uniref:UDP-N-acetylmuramoyl-L-alanyl-D-glutamate--2, 6-diaminopimelate ligase n=1 Tax=unclassified Sanguibacter TaxID=2645534 RepID=UPI0032AE8E5B